MKLEGDVSYRLNAENGNKKAVNCRRNDFHGVRDYRYIYPDSAYHTISLAGRSLLYEGFGPVLSLVNKQPAIWSLCQELHRRQRDALKNKNIDNFPALGNYRIDGSFCCPAPGCKDSADSYCHRGYRTYQPHQKKESIEYLATKTNAAPRFEPLSRLL